jgi:crotonobetainyl-CoA:carnitine CoA-transferase CaiB-like acyl-CoA transferase
VFQASDKSFYINCGNDKIFHRLTSQVIARPDLADDPTLCSRDGRVARRDELFSALNVEFGKQPWSHWQGRMRAAQIPCGLVRTVGEALRSPEAQARQLVTSIAHPVLGTVPNIASPIRYARTPLVDPVPAPAIGQHTAEVLQEVLGYSRAQVAQLGQQGAFGQRVPAETQDASV